MVDRCHLETTNTKTMFNYKKQLPGIDRSSDKNKMGRASSSALQMNTREYTTGPMPGSSVTKGIFNDFVKGKGALGLINPMGAIASKVGLFMKRGKTGCKCGASGCKC